MTQKPASSRTQRQQPQASTTDKVKSPLSSPELPAPLTPLIGREQEQAAIYRLLHLPVVRLVTLTGTGGVGKTRLALEIAANLRDEFSDGVHFISLAPIREPDLLMPTIAQALALKESGSQPLLNVLKASLHNKHLLFVLDNFEQILSAAPQLSDLLASCPRLKLLVTSRSRLQVRGEQEFYVAPLPTPDLTRLPILTNLAQVETIRLFIERAQALKADFALTEDNARAIAEICVRLVAQGLTDAQVAEKLVISPRTVNWHLTTIYSKLGVSSRSAATRYAVEHKLV